MVHFAENSACRRRWLLDYFGEQFDEPTAAAATIASTARDLRWHHRRAKFLSCIYRVRQKTGFTFGLNHIVEVLLGADSEAVRKWGHHEITVYGIGRDQPLRVAGLRPRTDPPRPHRAGPRQVCHCHPFRRRHRRIACPTPSPSRATWRTARSPAAGRPPQPPVRSRATNASSRS